MLYGRHRLKLTLLNLNYGYATERGAAVKCEICAAPVTRICSGLDVPLLGFCTKHGAEHEANCPDVRAERAWMSKLGASQVGAAEALRANEEVARAEEISR